MSSEANSETVEEPKKDEPANDIPGFFVTWMNGEGETEEGPLTVLWKLIESYRIDIFDVSLLKITIDFMNFMQRAGELKIDLASPFIVMAARLLFYKSKALLPDPGFEESESDPRLPPELIQQLLEYRRFQMASEQLRELDDITSGMFTRTAPYVPPKGESDENEDWLELDLVDLIRAYSDMVQRLTVGKEEERNYEISAENFSVDEKMSYIRQLLQDAVSFAFFDLFENPSAVILGELVVTFLAILELTKLREIIVKQERIFGEIRIFKKSFVVR